MDPTMQAIIAAFGMAKDLSVQLLTLGTGIIGFTLLIAKDIKRQHGVAHGICGIVVLAGFLVSNIISIIVIMKMTGLLAPLKGAPVLSLDQVRPFVVWQLIVDAVSMTAFVVYSGVALMVLRKQ